MKPAGDAREIDFDTSWTWANVVIARRS